MNFHLHCGGIYSQKGQKRGKSRKSHMLDVEMCALRCANSVISHPHNFAATSPVPCSSGATNQTVQGNPSLLQSLTVLSVLQHYYYGHHLTPSTNSHTYYHNQPSCGNRSRFRPSTLSWVFQFGLRQLKTGIRPSTQQIPSSTRSNTSPTSDDIEPALPFLPRILIACALSAYFRVSSPKITGAQSRKGRVESARWRE
jgi:hypothetical protein